MKSFRSVLYGVPAAVGNVKQFLAVLLVPGMVMSVWCVPAMAAATKTTTATTKVVTTKKVVVTIIKGGGGAAVSPSAPRSSGGYK